MWTREIFKEGGRERRKTMSGSEQLIGGRAK